MRSALTLATAGFGASASVIVPHLLPRSAANSSFTLVAYGKASGPIGQLYDGQNRIGGNLPVGYYTIKYGPTGGAIVDKFGRGCILTPPTTQWQCDEGVQGTPGFDIGCDKQLLFNGSLEFWACPVNDFGVWNLYTNPNFGQKKCITVTIRVVGETAPTLPCKPSTAPPPPKEQCSGAKDKCKPMPPPPAPAPCKDKCVPAPLKPSPDGTCGGTTGFHCKEFPQGSCCSSYGWCGSTPAHCGTGCQGGFGSCGSPRPPLPPPSPPCTGPESDKCKPAPAPVCSEQKGDKCKPVPAPSSPSPMLMPMPMPGGMCPVNLKGPYEFPHLIVPVDKSRPDNAFGNKLNGTISPHVCTIFNFDIHPSLAGKTCNLAFFLPLKKDLETSSYTYHSWSPEAGIELYLLDKPATWNTTWNTVGPKMLVGQGPLYPDVAVGAFAHKCAAGTSKSIMVCSKDMYLDYFQDYNPSPIGLYVRAC